MARPLRAALAGGAALAAATLTAPLASALSQEEVIWCVNASNEISRDEQIRACTSAILSGKWSGEGLAWAFVNRGLAYYVNGSLGLAFIDFNEAIRLDSKNAVAFNNRGLVRQAQGDHDLAMADYGEAIRLDPTYAFAFNNRGGAFKDEEDYDRAITDYTEAIRLDPEFAVAFAARGDAYLAKDDLDHAIADYDQAVRLDSEAYGARFLRGLAYLYSGALTKALADLKRSSELSPKHAYAALWLEILNRRSNLQGRLAEASAQLDMTAWPAPLIRLYLGQTTPEAAFAAADDADPNRKRSQTCEATFFVAQFELQRGAKGEAARLFRLAASDCSIRLIRANAKAELDALGAQP